MEQDRKPREKPITYGHLIFDKERVHNGEKKPSSISGAGKTGELHVKKCNYNTF